MIKKILGFDISSSCIGYCQLNWNIQTNEISFVSCDYFKPPKTGDIFERLTKTKEEITKIINKIQPDYIGIENIIEFMKGSSGAKTIIILALFNRTVGLAAYDYLKKSPELFNVLAIRHGLKTSKKLPDKTEMPELVANHLKIKFPYIYNKKNKIDVKSYDMADGVSVALYYAFKLSGKIKKKTKHKES